MERGKLVLLMLASLVMSSCGNNEQSSQIEESASSSSSEAVKTKELFFPTDVDDSTSNTGIDVFLGYDPYRITSMYVGEGVEEEILSYTYNEKYCTIDNLGRITPIKEGSALCYAVTKSGKYPFKVNVKSKESYRSWMAQSSLQMKENHVKRGSKTDEYIFVGDSFFDSRDFWDESKFYQTFEGKNVFITGIGTAKTNDWMTLKKEFLIDYSPKALFMNLGINNIINAGDNGKTLAAKLITLFEELHFMKPDMPIYYYGIIKCGDEGWNQKSAVSNDLIKEYALSKDYLTYLDIPSLVNDDIRSYLKNDSLHPNDACYAKFASLAKEHM